MANLNISGSSGPQPIEGASAQSQSVNNLPTQPPKLPESGSVQLKEDGSGKTKGIEERASSTSAIGVGANLKKALAFVGVHIFNYFMGPAAGVIDVKTLFSAAKKADTAGPKAQEEGGPSKLKQFLNSILSPASKKPEAKVNTNTAMTKETIDLSEQEAPVTIENFNFEDINAETLDKEQAKKILVNYVRAHLDHSDMKASIESFAKDETLTKFIKNLEMNCGPVLTNKLIRSIEPEAIANILYYNIMCKQEPAKDAHTLNIGAFRNIKEVKLEYSYNTPLVELQKQVRAQTGLDAVILRGDIHEGVYLPAELSEENNLTVGDADNIAIALPKADKVFLLPEDPQVKADMDKHLTSGGLGDID